MSGKKVLWMILCFLLLMALALFAYRYLTDTQKHTAPVPESSTASAVPAADFTCYDLQGNKVRLADFSGQPIVLHFWASWCIPCREELPNFQQAYETYGSEIQFFIVNLTDGARETEAAAKTFLQENNFQFPVYFDLDLAGMQAYQVYSLPTTILIDENHTVVHREYSALSIQKLETLLQSLRNAPSR